MNKLRFTGSALAIARRQTAISLRSVTETLGRYSESLDKVVEIVGVLNKKGEDTGALIEALSKAGAILVKAKAEIEEIAGCLREGVEERDRPGL